MGLVLVSAAVLAVAASLANFALEVILYGTIIWIAANLALLIGGVCVVAIILTCVRLIRGLRRR